MPKGWCLSSMQMYSATARPLSHWSKAGFGRKGDALNVGLQLTHHEVRWALGRKEGSSTREGRTILLIG